MRSPYLQTLYPFSQLVDHPHALIARCRRKSLGLKSSVDSHEREAIGGIDGPHSHADEHLSCRQLRLRLVGDTSRVLQVPLGTDELGHLYGSLYGPT